MANNFNDCNWNTKKKKKKTTTCYHLMLLSLLLLFVPTCWARTTITSEQMLEIQIQKELNRLNKPAVHSIESADGDIIDCVLISQQPAFDHPLLQNHTIQMRPKYLPEGLIINDEGAILDINSDNNKNNNEGDESTLITQLWQLNGSCPEGTIPIRRTKREDLLRASSISSFGKKDPNAYLGPNAYSQYNHEFAGVSVEGQLYRGAKASINVWKPLLQQTDTEYSSSQMWILAGVSNGNLSPDFNTIETGWHVNKHFYGDERTRFFIYWTPDGHKNGGCYNLRCSGFVQTNRHVSFGGVLRTMSTFDGPQFKIILLVWKDPRGGDWWLQYNNQYILGYWPSRLFSYLAKGAQRLEWGGEVINAQSGLVHTATQMGSGHFAEEGYRRASYFNIQLIDLTNVGRNPQNYKIRADHSNCYNVKLGVIDNTGVQFFYGGPGRNPNCP